MARNDRPPYQRHDLVAGKYVIRRVLGEGGMAVVYSALDTTCDRHVAIKILRPGVAARRALSADHLQREAATAVKLHERTPHAVEVLTAGITDDAHRLPFYVMERLYGESLRAGIEARRARRQRFEIIEVASTVTEIATPLAHAHQMGVVHRDVKPENVYLAEQRDSAYIVKLLDFGISALAQDDAVPARKRSFSGSRAYASPEQLDGHAPTPAVDVYALGLVLFEMLTFTLPHDRFNQDLTVAETALNVLRMPLPELAAFRNDVPSPLEGLVARCLAYRPEARPTALQVASVLRDVKRVFERSLLGTEDAYLTDVTGPPAEVLAQRLDGVTGEGAPLEPRRFAAAQAVDLRASTRPLPEPQRAAVTAVLPVDHEVYFMEPVGAAAGDRDRTDPTPQVFAVPPLPPEATAPFPAQAAPRVATTARLATAPTPTVPLPAPVPASPAPPVLIPPWPGPPVHASNHSVDRRRRGVNPVAMWMLLAACVAAMGTLAMTPSLLERRAARAAAASASPPPSASPSASAAPVRAPASTAPPPLALPAGSIDPELEQPRR